jgi:dihydroxy-acid dehydratase
MGAATVNIPAIVLSGGPMLNGHFRGQRTGSGMVIWQARQWYATGQISYDDFMEYVATSAPSAGHCNTMGTASSMNCMAEALGMSLPGCAMIPAPYRERGQMAYATGKRIVEMVHEDLKPRRIMTRAAFENAIMVCAAIGGSTNCPPHVTAIARHMGVELDVKDWEMGYDVPLLVNLQPAGTYLGEDFHKAGSLPAVVRELIAEGKIHTDAMTVSGKTIGQNHAGELDYIDREVIRPYDAPMKPAAGFLIIGGNIFDAAVMKTSVVAPEFQEHYLEAGTFEGNAVVFEGPEDYHDRIDDPALGVDENALLFIRNVGPKGYPGAAEVVNMRPPKHLIEKGVRALPCIGDGRQSGTSDSPSILNASPEAASGGNLALIRTGDRVRLDLDTRRLDVLVDAAELAERRRAWVPNLPASQTPWQEIQRQLVGELATGGCLEPAVTYLNIVETKGNPRHNH